MSRGPSDSPLHSPNQLFDYAREYNLLSELELLCREKALSGFVEQQLPGKLFINITPESLEQESHQKGQTLDLLKAFNLSSSDVVIELTEQFPSSDENVLLNAPMSAEQAASMIALVPESFKAQLLEQALDPHLLTMILLSAHMIIFWLSQDSNVTPPVCLTAFAAATIAGTPPMATGFTAWKIAKGLYIVPLIFAYTNFIGGSSVEVMQIFIFSAFGLYAFVGFMEGYLEGPLNIVLRLLSLLTALGLMWPHQWLWLNLLSLVVFIALFVFSKKQHPKYLAEIAV